jgi:hypothetical protein
MAKKQKMLEDLFYETLKDVFYAEKKILTALPKMAKAAQSEDLQAAFEKHEGETRDQVERLEQVFESMSAVWAKELEGSAITVNVLVPGGPTDTPMISDQSGWPREKMLRPEIMGPPRLSLPRGTRPFTN